ncbi:hypothetical protein [Mycobacterium pseudokansasii]|uniref:Uncharacterized protein n=1 Tax=Mycobacterium pseudokansasii TaxID=2341080 RepID=A0A498QZ81_9MYCO|nr:hypothetical protein [Mycobacterium pseudokansasii]VBA56008.1 hypothetical protein LAUMK142_05344 [Mycobacterium pseudokansasii]
MSTDAPNTHPTPAEPPAADSAPETSTPEGGAADPAGDGASPPQAGDADPKFPREQRYRVERNEARAHIEALQLREVERIAAEHLAQPGDLMELGGVELAAFVDDAGFVRPEAVAEAVGKLIVSRPGLAKNPRVAATDPTQGRGGGPLAPSAPTSFDGMFAPV